MSQRAAEAAGFNELTEQLTGPNAIAFSDDAVAPSRVLAKFAKKHDKLVLKGAIVEGKVVGVDTIKELSSLPNREGMLSTVSYTHLSFCHRDVPLLFHTFDSDAHIARCSGDNPHCCFYIIGVQIRHLVLSDFSALFQRDFSDDVGFGTARSGLDTGSLLDQN